MRRKTRNFEHRVKNNKALTEGSDQESEKDVSQCSDPTNERVQAEKRQYVCTECGKAFSQSSQLTLHQRVHTGEKPYECGACGKAFSRRSTLTQHQRVHTGENSRRGRCNPVFGHDSSHPSTGDRRGRAFSHGANLVLHWTIHTGEKLPKCNECGKTFSPTQPADYQKIHAGEKPYKCQGCGKAISGGSALIEHQGTHAGEKPPLNDGSERYFIHIKKIFQERHF